VTTYSLDAPFGIDNGELEGVPARGAFVLGAEFAMFFVTLQADPAEFTLQIHPRNTTRCLALCGLRKRKAKATTEGGWTTLNVGAEITS